MNDDEQLNLRDVIHYLQAYDRNLVLCDGFCNPHSYRGYYEELSFEPALSVTVGSMLDCAIAADGAEYEAWKGGEYIMGKNTPCNIAHEGGTGVPLTKQLLKDMLETAYYGPPKKKLTNLPKKARHYYLHDRVELLKDGEVVHTGTISGVATLLGIYIVTLDVPAIGPTDTLVDAILWHCKDMKLLKDLRYYDS